MASCFQALHKLYPGDIAASPETALPAILRAMVVRANFVPAVRHHLGWRGVNHCATETEAWTAKIAGWPGVFGWAWVGADRNGSKLQGRFQLNYFPSPEEELVEQFSVPAAAWTQQADYLPRLRQFSRYADLSSLFYIGDLKLIIDAADGTVELNLQSQTRLASRAEDGIAVDAPEGPVTLVAPGGWDQYLPAFEIARAVYEVIGASAGFCLEVPPSAFAHRQSPGHITCYWSDGKQSCEPDDTARQHHCCLAFGIEAPDQILCPGESNEADAICWQSGNPVPEPWEKAPWWRSHMIGDFKSLDKQLLGIDDRPALIVLTGFLGSGKTSFLQNFVAYQIQRDRFVAVVQNEIGRTGLDGKVLGSDNLVVTEIDEGCVCCTLIGHLKPALHQLCTRFQPDFVVLETTGLANPMNFMEELVTLDDLVRLDSVTTMVDGPTYRDACEASHIAVDQIKAADILLLNKADLMTGPQKEAAMAHLRRWNPHAPIIATTRGEVNPSLLYSPDPRDTCHSLNMAGPGRGGHHTHIQENIRSHKIVFPGPLDRSRFVQILEERLPPTIFRIKGIVTFEDHPTLMLVQYVSGRYEISEFGESPGKKGEEENFLIVIGQNIAPASLDELFHDGFLTSV